MKWIKSQITSKKQKMYFDYLMEILTLYLYANSAFYLYDAWSIGAIRHPWLRKIRFSNKMSSGSSENFTRFISQIVGMSLASELFFKATPNHFSILLFCYLHSFTSDYYGVANAHGPLPLPAGGLHHAVFQL